MSCIKTYVLFYDVVERVAHFASPKRVCCVYLSYSLLKLQKCHTVQDSSSETHKNEEEER